MLDQQKVWWQWLQKQKNIYKSILYLSTIRNKETEPQVKLSNMRPKVWFIQMCWNLIYSHQSKLNTNLLVYEFLICFFIVSENLSKLSIPWNNTKLTMFYTFHKNWQCVKSALNCFCFWSLYIFLGNFLCIQSWRNVDVKKSNPKVFFSFIKGIEHWNM